MVIDAEAEKLIEKLQQENKMLKNRCRALTVGTMCLYCPYDCERRTERYRGEQDEKS